MKTKNIVSFIISFILMVSITCTSLIVFFRGIIVNENFYSEILVNNNTVNEIYDNVNSGVNYVLISNFYPGLIKNEILSRDEIKEHLDRSILNLRDYFVSEKSEIPEIDMSEYNKKIKGEIDSYIKENKIKLDAENTAAFAVIEDTCNSVISSELEVINYNELSKSDMGLKIQKVVGKIYNNNILLGLFIIDAILIVVLFLIWRRRIHRAFAWVGYSFISSGILMILTFFSGYVSKFYRYPAIHPEHLKDNVVSIIEGYFKSLSIIGVVLFVFGIILMTYYWHHIYKVNEKLKSKAIIK